MKKRILSFLTLLCMVAALVPANVVFAATSGTCGDNLTWTLDDVGTLTISGTGDMTDWIYSNSMPWYSSKSSIKSIVIENGVTSIGACAFFECNKLTSVTISDSVTSISNAAFMYSHMSSIDIGKGITFIGETAFEHCYIQTGVNIKDITSWCNINFYSYMSNPLYYATKLYLNGELITDLEIPESVTSIGNYAFYSCSNIESVSISDGVAAIGDRAFFGCSGLKNVAIHDSVTSIGNNAFQYCSNLTNVYYYGTEADWNKIAIDAGNEPLNNAEITYLKYTKTTISDNGKSFIIKPININSGKIVILALYDENGLAEMQSAAYTGGDIPFTTEKDYKTAKVFVWNSLTDITPVCDEEIVKQN